MAPARMPTTRAPLWKTSVWRPRRLASSSSSSSLSSRVDWKSFDARPSQDAENDGRRLPCAGSSGSQRAFIVHVESE